MFPSIFGELYLQDLVITLLLAAAQSFGAFLILKGPARHVSPETRRRITLAAVLSVAALGFAHMLLYEGLARHFSRFWTVWGRSAALLWGVLSVVWLAAYGLTRLMSALGLSSNHSPGRRNFLRAAQAALFGAPAAAAGYGILSSVSASRCANSGS